MHRTDVLVYTIFVSSFSRYTEKKLCVMITTKSDIQLILVERSKYTPNVHAPRIAVELPVEFSRMKRDLQQKCVEMENNIQNMNYMRFVPIHDMR